MGNNAVGSGELVNGSVKPRDLGYDTVVGYGFARGDFESSEGGTLTDLTGASTTVKVPEGGGVILATFSAESACYGPATQFGWCKVEILANGTPLLPSNDFAFDSTDDGAESASSWEAHSNQRSKSLSRGTYTVKVQIAA